MQISTSFHVPRPPEEAWDILLDIPRIAPCMPGARLLEVRGEDSYDGEVQVRLGPVLLGFRGRAEIVERDEAARQAKVRASGRDTKGRGGANADISFALEPSGGGTDVRIDTDLALSGSIAQYGRASGMIGDLANHIVSQFADNLRDALDAAPAAHQATAEPEPEKSPAVAGPAAGAGAADRRPEPGPAPTLRTATPANTPGRPEARPIAGFRLALWLAWRQIRRLFARRA